MKKFAENWWHKKGQYYDQDSYLYPKLLVIDTFMAGFDAGRGVGLNEAQPAVEPVSITCPECGEPDPVLHCEGCGHNFNRKR